MSIRHINTPDFNFVNVEIFFLWEDLFVAKSCCCSCASSIEIVFYEYAVFKSHADADSFLFVDKYKKFIGARPVIHFRLGRISKGEDEHLSSSWFSRFEGIWQKSSHFISFVLFDQKNSGLNSVASVQKSSEGWSILGRPIYFVPVIKLIKNW